MAGQSQRGKIKTAMRARSHRMPLAQSNTTRLTNTHQNSDEGLGIFSNPCLTYVFCRYVIGNVGEVFTTGNEKLVGVVKAISPWADFGLSCAQLITKNEKSQKIDDRKLPFVDIKMVCLPNVKISDCLLNELKIDGEIARDCDTNSISGDAKELVPFFPSSEDVKECTLGQGSFSTDEMFTTNAKLFSVSSTYNDDLREYTTPVDRSAPNYAEVEAMCTKLAQEIEESSVDKYSMDDEADLGLENDEEKFSAVARNNKSRNVKNVRSKFRNASRHDSIVNNVGNQMSQVSIQPNKHSLEEDSRPERTNDVKVDKGTTRGSLIYSEKSKTTSDSSEVVTPHTPVADTKSTEVVPSEIQKKSVLDLNAPEFLPKAFQYTPNNNGLTIMPGGQQTMAIPNMHTQHYPPIINISQTAQMPTQAALITAGQPYIHGHQAGQVQQLLHTQMPACVPGTASQHGRNSLSQINQQAFIAPANYSIPHQVPPLTMGQMMPSSQSFVLSGRLSACPPSSANLARQRSDVSGAAHQPTYTPQQPTVPINTFHSPAVYQFTQNGGYPLLLSGHQMGLQLMQAGYQNPASSSALMISNVIAQQPSNQLYPAHVNMQPSHLQVPIGQNEQGPSTPSTTPQQTSQAQIYPQHFQEQPHPIQLSYGQTYQPNFLFAAQGASPGFYPAPTVLTGPNTVNPSVATGLLPVNFNQQAQHVNANVHPQSLEPPSMNPQHMQQAHHLNQANCQSQQLFQHYPTMGPAQLLQAHMGGAQPSAQAIQTFLTVIGAGGGAPAPAH